MPQTDNYSEIYTNLLGWYHQHRRDMPWRSEESPYRIWLSEVMLQQTQVNTVIPYYERFLTRFPTVTTLSQASLGEVLKMWEGLGYYARARNLHQAAIEIVEAHDGQLPPQYSILRKLPGFGEYTAGAVASIAFHEAVPAVDGNVKRVLSRLFAIQTDITRQPARRQINETANQLVSLAEQPGDWNQALIELGALLCSPTKPNCATCPVETVCQAKLLGIEETLPHKPKRKPLPHYDVAAAIIVLDDKYLIAQRPPEGMLGGLWEFPGGKQEAGESLPECLRREIQEELALDIHVGELLVSLKHSYTHFKITLHAFFAQLTDKSQQPQAIDVADWQWVTMGEIEQFAFPRTDLKVIEALTKQRKSSAK
ncbi:A/G-specific adenine glycosylase [Anaerolineales bacterium HSG6]|nr:A/G-specific adenine glycosylase [Anaerolineales bacterium HSG6]